MGLTYLRVLQKNSSLISSFADHKMLEHSLFNISTKSSGFTAIFGSNLDSIASSFQTQDVVQEAIKSSKTCPSRHSQPHITLITREDASLLKSKSIEPETLFPTPTLQDLHFIGLGSVSYSSSTTKRNLSFHVVVISPSINRIRLKNGLPMKDFHVTLTGDGSEQTGKPKSRGLDSLLEKLNLEPRSNNVEVLEALSKHHLLQGNLLLALETSVKLVTFLISRTLPSDRSSSTSKGESSRTDLIETLNQLPRALLLLGNMAFENSQFRLAMLSFSKSYSTSKKSHEPTTKIQTAAIRGILSCWKFTELGNCCLKEEWLNQLSTLPTSISKMIFQPWDPELKEEIRSRVETKSRDIGWSVDDRLVCERGKRLMVPIEEFELGLFDARPEDKVDFHEMQRFFVSKVCVLVERTGEADSSPHFPTSSVVGHSVSTLQLFYSSRNFGHLCSQDPRHNARPHFDCRDTAPRFLVLSFVDRLHLSSNRRWSMSKSSKLQDLQFSSNRSHGEGRMSISPLRWWERASRKYSIGLHLSLWIRVPTTSTPFDFSVVRLKHS